MQRIHVISTQVHPLAARSPTPKLCACALSSPCNITKLFVANRGEIALRVIRAAADLGIASVACTVAADQNALHAKSADETVSVPSYLDSDAIISAALEKKCDALHPGYGYLSESAEFCVKCSKAGITFVGPSPDILELFGDKTAARRFAKSQGVPVLRGSDVLCRDVEEVRQLMKDNGIDFPIMLKAAGGGGGRGIRPVFTDGELDDTFDTCSREAKAAFGVGGMFFEELVTKARHIEVQILGDGQGSCVHFYERDCSVQRRRQKIIESSPARHLAQELRDILLDSSVRLALACSYRGAGTFEFLVSGKKVAFMEANARIQVEHTVTEEACGIDLVRAQLLIAQGRSLHQVGLKQDQIKLLNYSIQARVILTRVGQVGSYSEPGGKDIRVDSCCFPGMVASSQFDPMVAKLIVRGPIHDPLAIDEDGFDLVRRRLVRACKEFHIGGSVKTNLEELQQILNLEEFRSGQWVTGFLDEWDRAPTSAAELNAHNRNHDRAKLLDDAFGGVGQYSVAKASPILADAPARETPVGCVWITSPAQGQVVANAKESVKVGDFVLAGAPVLVLNAMKMEFLIPSPISGNVVDIAVLPDQQVEEGQQVVLLREAAAEEISAVEDSRKENEDAAIRPSLQRLFDRRRLTSDQGRIEGDKTFAKRLDARHKRGQLSARENVANIVDPGTFIEYGQLVVAGQRRRRSLEDLIVSTPADGMIAGIGQVNSEFFPAERSRCAIMAYDYTVLAGTQGMYNHFKVDRIVEICKREALPIIWFCEGGGGRPGDTDGAQTAGLTCSSFMHFGELSGLVPLVGLTSGYCFAGNAAFLGVCDVVIATKGSNLGMGGPAMIEGGGLGMFSPTEIGPIEESYALGCVDVLVEDEAAAAVAAKRYISYFQGSLPRPTDGKFACADQCELRNVVPENRLRMYEMHEVIQLLFDTGSFMELRGGYGIGIIIGLARLDGRAVGVLANNPKHLGGAVDADGAMKASRFLELFDAFDLPIVVLCDCPGFMVGPEHEREGAVRKVSRMFTVGASITVPLITIVIRKAYGLGAQAMAGGMMMGPNSFCVAWPTGEIGPMGLEGAVKLGMSKELAEAAKKGPKAHKDLYDAYIEAAYNRAQAMNVAMTFEIDQVIDPAETRQMITQLLASHPPRMERRRRKKRPCVSTF